MAIANRWKEYVEELYVEEDNSGSLVENLIKSISVSNTNTEILKSELRKNFKQ